MKNNKLHKVTYDHTLVNLLVTAGELTKEEAKNHPKKNVLMKALGATTSIDIDIFDFELTADEMERIRALDKGVRFFNMSLSEQEAHLSAFTPAD